jgi:hypothetical protein
VSNFCVHNDGGEKVWIDSKHLIDDAHLSNMQLEMEESTPSWKCFAKLINLRFGPQIRSNPLGELAALRRTISVEGYIRQFSALHCHYLKLESEQHVHIFTFGILKPLQTKDQTPKPSFAADDDEPSPGIQGAISEETTPTPALKPPACTPLVGKAVCLTQPALPVPILRSKSPVKTSATAAPQH